jgi:lactose/L-arabinose transport system ATP-binding protein
VAGFIGSPRMNLIEGKADGGDIVLAAGTQLKIPGLDGQGEAVKVGIRPEHLRPKHQGDVAIEVAVDVVENLGGTRYIYGTLASGESVIVEDREKHGGRSGESLTVGFSLADALVFSDQGKRLRPAA